MRRLLFVLGAGLVIGLVWIAVRPVAWTTAPPAAAPAAPSVADPGLGAVAGSAAPPLTPPVPSAAPAPAAAPAPQAPLPASEVLVRINAALPRLGVKPPMRAVDAVARGDRLLLTMNAPFRAFLRDASATDELVGALADLLHEPGYNHLELRYLDERGQSHSIDDVLATPPDRRPRPEPIDDGVRR